MCEIEDMRLVTTGSLIIFEELHLEPHGDGGTVHSAPIVARAALADVSNDVNGVISQNKV